MDRAGGWVRDVLHGQVLGAPTPQPELFQLFEEEEPGGSRPACLVAPRGPQEAVQRHTVEQLADIVPMVQVLDAPGLLGEAEVVDLLREVDAPALDELVIAVPKISLVQARRRLGDFLRPTQAADQLVEVPTIISCSSLQQRIAEQLIDIPVPQVRRGGGGGLHGFRAGQGTTAFRGAEFVDLPVPPGRGAGVGRGGLQGFSQRQNSTAGLHGFLPGQSSSSSSRLLGNADGGIQGGFRTFSRPGKSARVGPHSGSELGADFTPWTPAAYAESMAFDDDESEAESESEAEVEDGAVTRFAAGFRPLRVCMRFLEHQMGRPVRGCAYGDRCTFAHSWAELHPEASAHEQQLASHFPD